MKKRIKIQGVLIFVVLLLVILLNKFVFPRWQKEHSDEFMDIIGLILVLSGFLLRIVARGYKEDSSQGGDKLVTQGPYYSVRNPMYSGTLLIGTGAVAVLFQVWALPIFLIIYFLIYIPQINKEEKKLLERFGEKYKEYCNSSSRYFPHISHLFNLKPYVSLFKLSWVRKEIVSLIATLTILCAIEIYQDVALFGFGEFLNELLEFLLVIVIFTIAASIFIWRNKDRI